MNNFDEIYQRILQATNSNSTEELCETISIHQSTISDAKRKGLIPAFLLIKLFDLFSLHPDWIRTGKGSMFIEK